mmetsp:Transcript_3067/g.6839  ORF Transcript_3067/g.6839 Transcript_3067/m.6839 type:complete len:190 (+) Transcript_3067:2178-2747(+)
MSQQTKIAILQNNMGVEYLQEGQHKLALQHFEAAALQLYQIAHIINNTQTTDTPVSSCKDMCISKEPSIVKENSFISSSPIFIHQHRDCNVSSKSYTMQSAAILFNMGLTYHLSFMQSYALDDAISNAMNLYGMAYSLAMQVSDEAGSNQIIMAALNNLGEIHHESGDFERSRSYLEDLTAYIASQQLA